VLEPLAATLATLVSVLAAWAMPPVSVYIATLAGIIVLIPGLTLTVAINELTMRHLVAGSTRLAGAAMLFLEIGVGVMLGSQLARLLPAVRATQLQPIPQSTQALAVLVAALAFGILFRAHPAISDGFSARARWRSGAPAAAPHSSTTSSGWRSARSP
jgi:uncharacterized membrane protein YjjB (DUF3815 family)